MHVCAHLPTSAYTHGDGVGCIPLLSPWWSIKWLPLLLIAERLCRNGTYWTCLPFFCPAKNQQQKEKYHQYTSNDGKKNPAEWNYPFIDKSRVFGVDILYQGFLNNSIKVNKNPSIFFCRKRKISSYKRDLSSVCPSPFLICCQGRWLWWPLSLCSIQTPNACLQYWSHPECISNDTWLSTIGGGGREAQYSCSYLLSGKKGSAGNSQFNLNLTELGWVLKESYCSLSDRHSICNMGIIVFPYLSKSL